ncbi:coiled-coil domain-containing protein 73 [Gouania willdenowi]|uniref:Coiled-coil domain containing 73 n=1 Tax=Gouania willdenowi TaxID=441366 RepID=A0A8C5D527_GOUWI|nr:coiled-coil domain-containing protein 73 [Gouania willdenowi]
MFGLPSNMDISSNTVTLPVQNALGEAGVVQELRSLSADCQTERGETILLQLLKFKTHLLDVVEELHIRRDAETRFEDQISKLVLEKQELQWEKESLETQLETATKQHSSSLSEVKKQFQAKFRSSEEEKGRYQVAAELKDKEINHLKDELKSLQLLKYNLEKKCSELEQKLSLQSRTKDSHMKQLEEVEKRFSVLSRQCAVVKQAHEKLEQSVDEAMRINITLTSATDKQEKTIVSLKKELEEVHNKLIKAKMTSTGNSKSPSLTGREQLLQQLHHKLNLETEMIKKLQDEVDAERAEKQEVIRSLQQTQGLLLNQTQTVKRAEVELQSQREKFQALKREHEVVREKSKAAENKVVQVMESLASSKTSWDKEKQHFHDRIKREQEGLQAVRDAYEDLNQQHTELTSHAQSQTQQIKQLQMENRSKSIIAPTGLLLTSVEDINEEEENSCLEVPDCGVDQHTVSFNSNSLSDTFSTRAHGGEEIPNQISPDKQTQIISPVLLTDNDLSSNVSGSVATESGELDKNDTNCNANEQDKSKVFDLITNCSSNDILKVKENGCFITLAAPCDLNCSLTGNVDIPVKENTDQTETDQAVVNDGELEIDNREEMNTKHEIFGKDEADEEGASAGKTTQRTERAEDNCGETLKSTEMTNNLGSETNDRADTKSQDEVNELVKTSKTQISTQTTADKTIEKSQILQVNEPLDNGPSVAVCEPSDCPTSPCQKDAELCFVNNTFEDKEEGYSICSDDPQTVSQELNCAVQAVQQSAPLIPTFQRTAEGEPMGEILGEFTGGVHFKRTTLQPNASLLSAPSDGIGETTESITNQTETKASSDFTAATRETSVTHTSEESQIVTKLTGSEFLPEYQACGTEQTHMLKPCTTDACQSLTVDVVQPLSVVKSGECLEEVGLDHLEKTKANKQDKLLKLSSANQDKASGLRSLDKAECKDIDDPVESSLSSCKRSYCASFDWCGAERKTLSSRTKPEASYLHQFIQESPMSGQSSTESSEFLYHPLSTFPTVIKSKPSKAPLIIMRASDLLNSSSVFGAAASWRRTQQGACEGAESGRERTAANTETSTFPVSTCSSRPSKPWSSTPHSNSGSAPGTVLQSDWEPSCSQEREDQQSSFRAQISKIEQFLNTERLRLPKRPRTDD